MYLVRRGHFRSRDKDSGHTIRSAIAESPFCTHTSRLYCLLYTEPELLPIVLHRENGDFHVFCSYDLIDGDLRKRT